jgi:hypothetical protein
MKRWIIAVVLGIALSAAGASGAFAQAGSTGGTLGNTDKSISGEREEPRQPAEPRPRHTAPQPKASSAACKLAMIWSNDLSGYGTSVWTISADGAAVEQGIGNARGHATLSGHTLTINWRTGADQGIYAITLNQACTAGTGKFAVTGGMLPGRSATATFTAMGPAQ